MASLVAPLACGISGASSGSAEFYREGTSTLAQVFSDANGETQVTSHALDAYGAVVRYVEERVDVVVLTAGGATVRTFTWGTDSRESRVENLGFTGTDSEGATVPGGKTTVDAVLTRLFESLGATDGNVLVNGEATTLSLALSSSAGLVYNVKSGYGATGDGTSDDGPEIQAALNAAEAAGGGIIYFPHGTYLCTTPVVAPNSTGKFFYLGESATASKLKQANTTTLLTLGTGNENVLMNLTFTATASNTGFLVSVGASSRATFLSCDFDPINGTQLTLSGRANLVGCNISQAGASSRIAGGAGAYLRLSGCDVTVSGTNMRCITDTVFTMSNATNWSLGRPGDAGTTHVYNAAGTFQIQGGDLNCMWTAGTVNMMGNSGAIQIANAILTTDGASFNAAAAGSTLYESTCIFGSGTSIGVATAGYSHWRQFAITVTSDAATSYTPSGAYTLHEVTTTATSFTFNAPSPAVPVGSSLVILFKNGSGSNFVPSFVGDYRFVGNASSPTAVNAGNTAMYVFHAKFSGSITGSLVSDSPNPAAGVTI